MPDYISYDQQGNLVTQNHQQAWAVTTERMQEAGGVMQRQSLMTDYLDSIQTSYAQSAQTTESVRKNTYGTYFKDVIPAQRTKTTLKEIKKKEQNAACIEAAAKKRQQKQLERARKAGAMADYSSDNPDLVKLSVFMRGSAKNDAVLVESMIGLASTEESRSRTLQTCMRRFLDVKVTDRIVKDESTIASNADTLENLSEKFDAISYLITNFPEEYAGLDEEVRRYFEVRYARAKSVVYFYRLKKAVMTDEYYRSHGNKEIGINVREEDSTDKKILAGLIWQAEGGMEAFLQHADNMVENGNVTKLAAALKKESVTRDREKLRKELAARKKALEKRGTLSRYHEFHWEGNAETQKTGSDGLLEHVAKIRAVELTGDPDKDAYMLSQVMDQLQIAIDAESVRKSNEGYYYLERSEADVMKADMLIDAVAVIRRLKDDLLTIAKLNELGSMDTSVTAEQIQECRDRYLEDLKNYRDAMALIAGRHEVKVDIQKNDSPSRWIRLAKKVKPETDPQKIEDKKKEIAQFIAALTNAKFSDIQLYRNRDKIGQLYTECTDPKQKQILETSLKMSCYLYERKRVMDLKVALDNDPDNESLQIIQKFETVNFENDNVTYKKDIENIMKLRGEAERSSYDFEDMKAIALHYNDQSEWAVNASTEEIYGASGTALVKIAKFLKTEARTFDHGEVRYNDSVNKMAQVSQELQTMDRDNPLIIQRGEASQAPAVNMTEHYLDEDKCFIRSLCEQTKGLLDGAAPGTYPADLYTAFEAIGYYSKLQGVVNRQSVEMEMAFLDKYRKCVDRVIAELAATKKGISFEDPVILNLMTIESRLTEFTDGTLNRSISKAELAAAMVQKPIYTDPVSMDSVLSPLDYSRQGKESNVKDIPLFLHRPNLNDVKQGYTGDCYFLAAVTALIQQDPGAIQNMFYDLHDGTVLVRLYMAYDENNRRVDGENAIMKPGIVMKPSYIRVRKDYETCSSFALDCMWVQLLEKAMASTGAFHHVAKVDEKGELHDGHLEISSGDSRKTLMHFTGKHCYKSDVVLGEAGAKYRTRIKNETRRRVLAGVPLYLHDRIWDGFADGIEGKEYRESPEEHYKVLKKKIQDVIRDNNTMAKSKLDTMWEMLEHDKVVIKDEDKAAFEKRYNKLWIMDVDAVTERILYNIEHPDVADITKKKDYKDFSEMIQPSYEAFKKGEGINSILYNLDSEKATYYYELTKSAGATVEQFEKEKAAIGVMAENNAAAMLEPNPGKRYRVEELAMLHRLRLAAKNKRAATVTIDGHVMASLDTKLHNGKWFVLIRDTHNIYNYTYTTGADGKTQGKLYRGFKPFVEGKKTVQQLDGDTLKAFYGTSWWELRDLASITCSTTVSLD